MCIRDRGCAVPLRRGRRNAVHALKRAVKRRRRLIAIPVSYTHLDVYKRQTLRHGIAFGVLFALTILFYNLAIASGPLSYTTFYFSASMLAEK